MSASFIGNVILKGKIHCVTGLHIGGSKDKFEIGGVDSPVIRDPNTNFPYIPGSSLKGKMRSLLAFALGKAEQDPKPNTPDMGCPLQRIFGVGADDKNKDKGPTRLIVRDSHADFKTVELWKTLTSELLYTEYKPENTIDRITSMANPRFLERVVKGSEFNFEFVYGIYRIDQLKDEDYLTNLFEAMRLLEHSTLGGSGSRGYGQIEFKMYEPFVVLRDDYLTGSDNFKNASKELDKLIVTENWWSRLSEFDNNKVNEIIKKFNGN